jgi:hypothetical protein
MQKEAHAKIATGLEDEVALLVAELESMDG